jgi:Tfp pilus assembly protein PilO
MKRKLSPRAMIGLFAGALLLVTIVGWLAVVAPQRSKAASLKKELDATQAQVLVLSLQPKQGTINKELVKVGDVFRLSKAVPSTVQMPDILLELSRIAGEAGITFDSITPATPVLQTGYEVVPISVVFQGNYFGLSELLYRLRNLVEVHDQRLVSTGRLFDVDRVSFKKGDGGFPNIQATLSIDAFVYTGMPLTGVNGSTDTTATSTSTSTSTSSAPPVAAAAAGGAS